MMEPAAESWSSVSVVLEEKDRERREDEWSSIPVLVLWKIKDKLDIFDNKRFAAVCRDWLFASNCYPKVLQTIGGDDDGLPWISPVAASGNNIWEFASVTREHKFKVDMPPECDGHSMLFSKKGWLLMRKSNGIKKLPDSLFLVNPFTRAKIDLPSGMRLALYPGCFTTDSDGYPQRVFLVMFQDGYSKAIIKTTSPGDKEWTDHTFLSQQEGTKFFSINYFITIGQFVYWYDYKLRRAMAFNVTDISWKLLPPPPPSSTVGVVRSSGFVTEHEGGLIYVEHVYDTAATAQVSNTPPPPSYSFSSFAFFRYDHVASSWTRMSNDELKDTSWFYDARRHGGCITTTTNGRKGKGGGGLKIYHLRQHEKLSYPNINDGMPRLRVEVYHLSTGYREILPVPFQNSHYFARWVDIG